MRRLHRLKARRRPCREELIERCSDAAGPEAEVRDAKHVVGDVGIWGAPVRRRAFAFEQLDRPSCGVRHEDAPYAELLEVELVGLLEIERAAVKTMDASRSCTSIPTWSNKSDPSATVLMTTLREAGPRSRARFHRQE